MIRKIHLKPTTQPKLEAVKGAPVVTWNSGDIEQVHTKRMVTPRRRRGQDVLLCCVCVGLALIIVASVVFVLWWLGSYAMV